MIKDGIKAGRLLKTFGTDGDLRCQIDDRFIDLIRKGKYVWVEIDGLMVPFEVTKFLVRHKPLIGLADVRDDRQASLLSGHWLYLRPADYSGEKWPEGVEDQVPFGFLIDFTVHFTNHPFLGTITKVVQYPGQEIAFVQIRDMPGKEFMIPLVDEFIAGINEEERVITLEVPNGLLEL